MPFDNKTCKDCVFYGDQSCHRNPPVMIYNPELRYIESTFPYVESHHWCGRLIPKSFYKTGD